MITLSLAAKAAALVGEVSVKTELFVPEKTAPQILAPGAAATVSVVSNPVVGPCVNVTEEIALEVKLNVLGKVKIIVFPEVVAPDGVVNLIR